MLAHLLRDIMSFNFQKNGTLYVSPRLIVKLQ